EGPTWDFKQEWPFSYSDDYFGGIARLICAFANTYGGLIIFGVHDQSRTGGHNGVIPNMDRLQKALGQSLTGVPRLVLRRYSEDKKENLDLLLVRPNSSDQMPIRFRKAIGGYQPDVIWVRQNHEVIAAEPRHLATLYCRAFAQTEDS